MIPRAYISRLTFSNGTELHLEKSDIVLIVGPNNVGKSATLRAIRDRLINPEHRSPIIFQIELQREGTIDDLIAWINKFARKNEDSPTNPVFQALGVGIHLSQAQAFWISSNNTLRELTRFFCHLVTADERLQAANPAQNIAIVREAPSHPLHYL
ncbi:MAG: AAA family ATPase, partial [Chloroflexi bacterium]|nr:AAA family ATPase [Chloroflexota bacterium]